MRAMLGGARRMRWRTGAALAFVYLLCVQSLLSPLASLRMEAAASWFGVTCYGAPQDDPAAPARGGSHCDVSCLLRTQLASAPPVDVAPVFATPAVFARVAYISGGESAVAVSHGRRPQSQRAPPLA